MDAVADFQFGNGNNDFFRNAIGAADHFDLALNQLQHAADLDARAQVFAFQTHGHVNVNDEVHVQRGVGHRVALDVAGQHLHGLAVKAQLVVAGEEVALAQAGGQIGALDGDGLAVFALLVDNGGNKPVAAQFTRGALAGFRLADGVDNRTGGVCVHRRKPFI